MEPSNTIATMVLFLMIILNIVKAYTTYISPLLEYVSSIWNPGKYFLKKFNINLLFEFTSDKTLLNQLI